MQDFREISKSYCWVKKSMLPSNNEFYTLSISPYVSKYKEWWLEAHIPNWYSQRFWKEEHNWEDKKIVKEISPISLHVFY